MARLIYGMNVSLDGFVDHDRFAPDPALFDYFIEQSRRTAGSLYGRGLYEVMRYWDSEDRDQHGPDQQALRAFTEAWRAMPKWVVSRTLTEVGPNATLVGGTERDLVDVVRDLTSSLEGEIEVGGPVLAASLSRLGLIDEYHLFLHPVVLQQGRPFFPEAPPPLRLLSSEPIGEEAVRLTYVPRDEGRREG